MVKILKQQTTNTTTTIKRKTVRVAAEVVAEEARRQTNDLKSIKTIEMVREKFLTVIRNRSFEFSNRYFSFSFYSTSVSHYSFFLFPDLYP